MWARINQKKKGGKSKQSTVQTENKWWNDRLKPNRITNSIKCKWSKHYRDYQTALKKRRLHDMLLKETYFKYKEINKLKEKKDRESTPCLNKQKKKKKN